MFVRRSATVLGSAALLVLGTAVPAQATEPAAPGPAPGPVKDRTVTLITGDKVIVDGAGHAVHTQPARGREGMRFLVQQDAARLVVTPTDAVPLIAAGRLDQRLFDVTGLLAAGYTDARRDTLPLIVAGRPDLASKAITPGVAVTRYLPSVDGAAVQVRKADAAAFWSVVPKDTAAPGTAVAPGTGTALGDPGAAPGAGTIWLDGLRKPMLDHIVPRIGAPVAWQAGLTGRGVTVAVLDTGVDPTHPDLAGQVVEARNFVDDDQPVDQVGHGTHVASTIAGTGSASDGRYRGVAPDTSLLNGKVCAVDGCPESAILAGMQWAVDRHARVVNLSLGGSDNAEIDPLEEAVNRLTEQAGTLFVIAAGNAGRCSAHDRVASPASADAALSVGAVDGTDAFASFSCQGPRVGDGAVKPDITAPGAGIVAARAKGTPNGDQNPVDDWYTRLSGTSMATPHVAGSAALLAQAHPEWTAGQLKAQLMASARVNPANTAFQQGAGRVDLARALTQTLTTSPTSVSLPGQPWPHTDDTPVTRTLTYHNAGSAPITLALAVTATGPDGAPAPAGMVRLSADTLTVPAGGSADVDVTADTSVAGPDGDYAGRLVATGPDETPLSTPLGTQREVESYNLTLRHRDRAGATPTAAVGYLMGDFDQRYNLRYTTTAGTTTIRLPRGSYAAGALVQTGTGADAPMALLGTPKVDLTHDVDLTFDARTAKPIDVRPPRASARLPEGLVKVDMSTAHDLVSFGLYVHDGYQRLTMGHVGADGDPARFRASVHGDWLQPDQDGQGADSPYIYHLTWYSLGRMFDGLYRRPGTSDLATVHADYPGPHDRYVTTSSVAVPNDNVQPSVYLQQDFPLPNRITHFFQPDGVAWVTTAYRYRLVDGDKVSEATQSTDNLVYRRGQVTRERWWAGVLGPTLAQPNWFAYQTLGGGMRIVVPPFGDGNPGHFGTLLTDTARTTLYRDGTQVAQSGSAGQIRYRPPAAAATYRLDTEATQSIFDTSTRITASWRFQAPALTATYTVLPILAVRFAPEVDQTIRAPGGRPFQIPITVQRSVVPESAGGTPVPEVASLTVEASQDDGASWQPVFLRKSADQWTATLYHKVSGFVSLRATAVDLAGNSVEQTIIRAYGLR
jgi:subtilisin family serine protease